MSKILVIGDIIIDEYIYVRSERRAQEANIPVYKQHSSVPHDLVPGGAGNTYRNVRDLLVTSEIENVHLAGICQQVSFFLPCEFIVNEQNSVTKTRYIDDRSGEILFRYDKNDNYQVSSASRLFLMMKHEVDLASYDIILVSDYDKGTVTHELARLLIDSGTTVVVDSKRSNLSMYRGAFALNVNAEEYSVQSSSRFYNVNTLFENIIVTHGSEPTELMQLQSLESDLSGVKESSYETRVEQFSVNQVEVVDTIGCGDTHAAAFAVGLSREKGNVRDSIIYANRCATVAVQKQGTVAVSKWDFLKSLDED